MFVTLCFSKFVPDRSVGLPGLNGLFTGGENSGPKVRVTELYKVSCLGSWSTSSSGCADWVLLKDSMPRRPGVGMVRGARKEDFLLSFSSTSFHFFQMSLLSNTFLYSLLGEFFFPNQSERMELLKDIRITRAGIVACFIHDDCST